MENRYLVVILILVLASLGAFFSITSQVTETSLAGTPSQPMTPSVNVVSTHNAVTTKDDIPTNSSVFITPKVRVSGVATGANGSPLAIVSIDGSPDEIFRIGDRLGESATIIAIDTEALTYQLLGKNIRVVVKSDEDSSQADAKKGTKFTPRAPVVQTAPDTVMPGFIPSIPEKNQSSGNRDTTPNGNVEFRKAIEKKMQSFQ